MWSFIHKHLQGFLSLLFAIAIALFWAFPYRCALSYQEQYQLFLFTPSYFTERISVPGGLADYVAEFITQFYYVYALGAILLALVFFSLQRLTWVLMRRNGVSPSWYPLSFIRLSAHRHPLGLLAGGTGRNRISIGNRVPRILLHSLKERGNEQLTNTPTRLLYKH